MSNRDFDYLAWQSKLRQDAIMGRYDRTQRRLLAYGAISVGLVVALYMAALGLQAMWLNLGAVLLGVLLMVRRDPTVGSVNSVQFNSVVVEETDHDSQT